MQPSPSYLPSRDGPPIASGFSKWRVVVEGDVATIVAAAPARLSLTLKVGFVVLLVAPLVGMFSYAWLRMDKTMQMVAAIFGPFCLLVGLGGALGAIVHAHRKQHQEMALPPLLVFDRRRRVLLLPRRQLEIPIEHVRHIHRITWQYELADSIYACHVVLECCGPDGTRWIPMLNQVPPIVISNIDRVIAKTIGTPVVTTHLGDRPDWIER